MFIPVLYVVVIVNSFCFAESSSSYQQPHMHKHKDTAITPRSRRTSSICPTKKANFHSSVAWGNIYRIRNTSKKKWTSRNNITLKGKINTMRQKSRSKSTEMQFNNHSEDFMASVSERGHKESLKRSKSPEVNHRSHKSSLTGRGRSLKRLLVNKSREHKRIHKYRSKSISKLRFKCRTKAGRPFL